MFHCIKSYLDFEAYCLYKSIIFLHLFKIVSQLCPKWPYIISLHDKSTFSHQTCEEKLPYMCVFLFCVCLVLFSLSLILQPDCWNIKVRANLMSSCTTIYWELKEMRGSRHLISNSLCQHSVHRWWCRILCHVVMGGEVVDRANNGRCQVDWTLSQCF